MTEEHKQKLAEARQKAKQNKAGISTNEVILSETNPEIKKITEDAVKQQEDTVEIKKSDFDKMMRQMEKQAKDIELLYKAADKGRISRELGKEGQNLIKQAKVRTWTGADGSRKLVIKWGDLITNRCEIVNGRWIEEQTTSVTLDDGEIITIPYLEFVRNTLIKEVGDIISKTEETDEKGKVALIYKLQFPTGKTLLINSAFLN